MRGWLAAALVLVSAAPCVAGEKLVLTELRGAAAYRSGAESDWARAFRSQELVFGSCLRIGAKARALITYGADTFALGPSHGVCLLAPSAQEDLRRWFKSLAPRPHDGAVLEEPPGSGCRNEKKACRKAGYSITHCTNVFLCCSDCPTGGLPKACRNIGVGACGE